MTGEPSQSGDRAYAARGANEVSHGRGKVILVIPFPSKEEHIGETGEVLGYCVRSVEVIVPHGFTSQYTDSIELQ